MKSILILIACAMAVGTANAKAPAIQVSKYGKVLTPAKLANSNIQTGDAPQLTVEMVQVKGSEEYLMKFTGIEHADDGKVLQYSRQPAGAAAWYYTRKGSNRFREEKPMYSDVTVYTLYANNKEYKLVVDAEATKSLIPTQLAASLEK